MTIDSNDTQKTREIVLSLQEGIGRAERDFNSLQAGYRKLASGWLMAVFGALGILLKSKESLDNCGISAETEPKLILAVGVAGFTGVIILWLVDMPVYHKLLLAYFKEGLRLENENAWLPKIRQNMKRSPVILSVTIFYLSLAHASFWASYLLLKITQQDGSPWIEYSYFLIAIMTIIVVCGASIMRRAVKNVFDPHQCREATHLPDATRSE